MRASITTISGPAPFKARFPRPWRRLFVCAAWSAYIIEKKMILPSAEERKTGNKYFEDKRIISSLRYRRKGSGNNGRHCKGRQGKPVPYHRRFLWCWDRDRRRHRVVLVSGIRFWQDHFFRVLNGEYVKDWQKSPVSNMQCIKKNPVVTGGVFFCTRSRCKICHYILTFYQLKV